MITHTLTEQPVTQQLTASFSLIGLIKRMGPSLLESSIPFATYFLIKSTLHTSDVVALSVGAIIPAVLSTIRFVRSRSVDIINLMIVLGIVGSILAAIIGGNAQLLLIRESAVGGLFGLAFLGSLLCPRPLCFYIIRHVRASNDTRKIATFDAQWQQPEVRRAYRLLTAFWGLSSLGEFILRLILVFTLSIPAVLAITAVVFPAIYITMAAMSMWYLHRLQKRIQPVTA